MLIERNPVVINTLLVASVFIVCQPLRVYSYPVARHEVILGTTLLSIDRGLRRLLLVSCYLKGGLLVPAVLHQGRYKLSAFDHTPKLELILGAIPISIYAGAP